MNSNNPTFRPSQLEVAGNWNGTARERDKDPAPWVWEGFIARGGVTLLTGAAKSGKSTLIAMLDRRRQGGQLLGKPVQAGKTVIVSEENSALWDQRQQRFNFGPDVYFCRPLVDAATPESWRGFVDHLLGLKDPRDEEPDFAFDLLIIDTLAFFMPGGENHAGTLVKALKELRILTHSGILLSHHPRRAGGRVCQAARGSSALTAFADILLDLRIPPGNPATRRRTLHAVGRHLETPRELLAEMNESATDYRVFARSDVDAAVFAPALDALRRVIGEATAPLTRAEILTRWPAATRPSPTTLWRWLKRACADGILTSHGAGKRGDALRYSRKSETPEETPAFKAVRGDELRV